MINNKHSRSLELSLIIDNIQKLFLNLQNSENTEQFDGLKAKYNEILLPLIGYLGGTQMSIMNENVNVPPETLEKISGSVVEILGDINLIIKQPECERIYMDVLRKKLLEMKMQIDNLVVRE